MQPAQLTRASASGLEAVDGRRSLSPEAILVECAERDFERGLARMRARIREAHGPVVGPTIDALVVGAVATLRLRSRRRDDARFLIELARRVQAGEDGERVAAEHIDEVLRLRDSMAAIARANDPDLHPAKEIATALFARRLPDLARLASVQDAVDYDDLVRKAFPDRSEVEAIVEDNLRSAERIVSHLERHPHVLRVPQSLAPRIAHTAREFIVWKGADVRRGVDEIYRGRC